MTDTGNDKINVLGKQTNWEDLYFYQKADIIYQMSFAFCNRFIHPYKDRTRDQIIQAARSCKQNIVEGLADGVTSSEMQMKLLNVARASLKELREDFEDYLSSSPKAVSRSACTKHVPASASNKTHDLKSSKRVFLNLKANFQRQTTK